MDWTHLKMDLHNCPNGTTFPPHSSERRWACLDLSMQKVEGGLLKITDSLLSPAGQSFYASVPVCFTELCWLNELYGQYFSVLVTVMQDVRSESVGLQCVCIPPLVDSTLTPLFLGKRWPIKISYWQTQKYSFCLSRWLDRGFAVAPLCSRSRLFPLRVVKCHGAASWARLLARTTKRWRLWGKHGAQTYKCV